MDPDSEMIPTFLNTICEPQNSPWHIEMFGSQISQEVL